MLDGYKLKPATAVSIVYQLGCSCIMECVPAPAFLSVLCLFHRSYILVVRTQESFLP